MSSIESQIKQEFAKLFCVDDWPVFKLLAEYYLRTATRLRKRHIEGVEEPFKLLARMHKSVYLLVWGANS